MRPFAAGAIFTNAIWTLKTKPETLFAPYWVFGVLLIAMSLALLIKATMKREFP